MADQLKIEIDVSAAKTALDSLGKAFTSFQNNATTQVGGVSKLISRLNEQMRNIKAVNPNVLNTLTQVNTAINNMNAGGVTAVAAAMERLSGSAGGAKSAADAMAAMKSALDGIKAPEGLNNVSVNFRKVGDTVNKTTEAMRAQAKQAAQNGQAFRQMGTEVTNAIGYMAGFGVSIGNIITSLQSLNKNGVSVGGVMAGLRATFGNFGGVAVVFGAIGIAVAGLASAMQGLIGPAFEVGKAFSNFKIAIDTIDEGTGLQTMAALQKVAYDTAQDISTLSKNYTGLRVAAQSAGISQEETLRITKAFGGALRVLGADSVKTEKAFLALTQMFSKGKVQAEELRGQLGDALPGALNFAAQSLNLTTAELDKMMKAGDLLAKDLIPKFATFLEVKFGDAVKQQAETAAGAMTRFQNAMTLALAALAAGNFGGIMDGIAKGVGALAKVFVDTEGQLNSSVAAIVGAIGDLIGIIIAATGGVLAGFAAGMTDLVSAVGYLLTPVRLLAEAIGVLISYFTNGLTPMEATANVLQALGYAIGAAVTAWGLYKGAVIIATAVTAAYNLVLGQSIKLMAFAAPLTASTTALNGMNAAVIASTAAMKPWAAIKMAAGAALTGLVGGVKMFGSAIGSIFGVVSKFNPLLRALTIGISAGTAVYGIATTAIKAYQAAQEKTVEVAASVDTANSVVEKSLKNFNETLAETPEQLLSAADALFSFEGAMKRAELASTQIDDELDKVNQAMRDHDAAVAETSRRNDDFTNGIKAQIQELEAQRNSAKSTAADFKDLGVEFIGTKESLRGVNERITDLREELQNVGISINDAKNRDADYRDSLEQSKAALERQKAALKDWGVALNDTGMEVAKQLVALGATKDEAAKTAYAYQTLMMTEKERGDMIARQLETEYKKIELYTTLRNKLAEVLKAEEERLRTSGYSQKEIEAMTSRLRSQIAALDSQRGTAIDSAGALEYLNEANKSGQTASEAAANATKNLTERTGESREASELAAGAADKMIEGLEGTKTAADKTKGSAEELKKANEKSNAELVKTAEKAKEASTKISEVGTTLDAAKTKLDTANTSFAALATSFATLKTSVESLQLFLPVVTQNLSDMIAKFTENAEPTNLFVAAMGLLKENFAALAISSPVVSASFVAWMPLVPAVVEPLNSVVLALEKLPGLAPGVDALGTSIKNFLDYMIEAVDDIQTTVAELEKIKQAGIGVAEGMDAGVAGGDRFIGKLNDVISKAGEGVTAMNQLKDAADAAYEAARRANEEASKSKGNSTGNREGGYSEASWANSSAIIGSKHMGTAPEFAEGTANTSRYASKLAGGGIPSILHPNEAVVPLSRGRKIPVEINMAQQASQTAAPVTSDINLAPLNDLSYSVGKLTDVLGKVAESLGQADMAQAVPEIMVSPIVNVEAPSVPAMAPMVQPSVYQSPDGLSTPNLAPRTDRGEERPADSRQPPINITVNVSANDVDSFRRSEDQIARSLSEKLRRAQRRTTQ